MTLRDLLDKLDDGATKLNVIDSEGIVLFRGIWFCEMNPEILDFKIEKIVVEDYLLNIIL